MFQVYRNDVHTLAVLFAPRRGVANYYVSEDLSKEIHETFLNYVESSPITRTITFEQIIRHLAYSKYPLPTWFPDRMVDCLSNANSRFLMQLAKIVNRLPQVRLRLLNADLDRYLLKNFFRSLEEVELTPGRQRSMHLFGVYMSLCNLLEEKQQRQVESSSFWQTIQDPPNTLTSNQMLATRLLTALKSSRHEMTDLVKIIIQRISQYEDVRLQSLNLFTDLYSIYEPDIGEDYNKQFGQLISDSLERDFQFTTSK